MLKDIPRNNYGPNNHKEFGEGWNAALDRAAKEISERHPCTYLSCIRCDAIVDAETGAVYCQTVASDRKNCPIVGAPK